jgi:hypothetical protein
MRFLPLLLLPLAACAAPGLSTDFEGASLGRVQQLDETHYRGAVVGQADHDNRNRQPSWYCFRLDDLKGREVTVTLTDLIGEYNYKPGALCVRPDIPPVVSGDGKTWRHLDRITVENNEATIRVVPDSNAFWVAHIEPYPASRFDRFLDGVRGRRGLTIEEIGKSVEGRPIRLLTITEAAPEAPVVWLMCRQGAINFLLSDAGASLRRKCRFRILPMMDPDGCAHGGVRFNRNGYDVNRNWDTADPESPESRKLMPEICAAKVAIRKDPGFFVTLHNQETGEWLSGSAKHPETALAFYSMLRDNSTFNPHEDGPRKPPGKSDPGRASVYEYLENALGVPAFLIEQGITKSSKLGRQATSEDRRDFGAQLIRVMASIVWSR